MTDREQMAHDTRSRLAELEFEVAAVLGRTVIPLGQIFKMRVGSVIEFGPIEPAPVQIVVNERTIARGQLVRSGTNYGVMIRVSHDCD